MYIPGTVGVRLIGQFTSDNNGVSVLTVPAGMRYFVQPIGSTTMVDSCSLVGTTLTVNFKKLKSNGLGATLGTLLSVDLFESSTGAVTFNLFGGPDGG